MLALRSVGTLSVDNHGEEPPLPLAHPSQGSVILVSEEQASEHDSFNGACTGRCVTPPPSSDGVSVVGLGTTGQGRIIATTVVGENRKTLLVQFHAKHGLLGISDVTRGLFREFLRLRLSPPRGSSKGTRSGLHCVAGSQTTGSGLVFLAREGLAVLQVVKVDPVDDQGSLSQSLGSAGPVLALACHPTRQVVAAGLTNGTVEIWDYGGLDSVGRRGVNATDSLGAGPRGGDLVGGGNEYSGVRPASSPPLSPARTRGLGKGTKEDKLPLKPRLEGKLSRIAVLSGQEMPWGVSLAHAVGEGFHSVAFHPTREWLCACTDGGLIGVWNLDGVVNERPDGTTAGNAADGGYEGEGEDGKSRVSRSRGAARSVRRFAGRVFAAANVDGQSNGSIGTTENASVSVAGGEDVSATRMLCAFLAPEPVILVALSPKFGSGAGPRQFGEPTDAYETRLVLLSLLDSTLPVLCSIIAPHAIAGLCVEIRSGRIFASRSAVVASSSSYRPISGVPNGSGGGRLSVSDGSSVFAARKGSAAVPVTGVTATRGGTEMGSPQALEGGSLGQGGSRDVEGEAAISVLAIASGTFLDRGPSRLLNTTMEVPPTVFVEGVVAKRQPGGPSAQQQQAQQRQQHPLLPLPLQVYFLRSMAVLIHAGPGGGVDIPAVKAVLHAQGLERDKGLKDRSKPRRLASLPGHTDDLLRHARGGPETTGYPPGHLMPYRLVPGPLLRLTEEGSTGKTLEERRRFFVLYEIVASEGSNRPAPSTRDAALSESSRTVCGLVTPAGYGEAHGRYENEAQLSHLFPATDCCFVSTAANREPSALLIEGGGYLAAVYSIPDMQLLGRKALSLPVTRALATPGCMGSQRGKVLYVVRSPRSPSGFFETMVYSDRGGLQCPEPLLPVARCGKDADTGAGWGGLRPYANAHLVLEANERVVQVTFQHINTVAELTAWGYRQPRAVCGSSDNAVKNPAVPMLAVLTTRRVLMLAAPRLTIVAEAWGHPRSSRTALADSGGLSVSPVSIAWAGASIICALEDGRVVYLKAGDGMEAPDRCIDEPDVPGGGHAVRSPWQPLCSLDRRLCAGGIGLAACLPDRLCFVVKGAAGGGIAHLVTRPLFPLEPLIAGVLAAAGPLAPSKTTISVSGTEAAGMDPNTLDLLKKLVARYAPPRTRLLRGANSGDGPGLGAGATCAVFNLLSRYGLHVLAAEVAGVKAVRADEIDARPSDVFMRRRPWISPLDRGRCAAELDLPLVSMLESIGDDPALMDAVADPDAMTSATLPAVGSRLSRLAVALAGQSEKLGLLDDAARLLDLSGEDALLRAYLEDRQKDGTALSGNHSFDAEAEEAAAARLKALRRASDDGGDGGSTFLEGSAHASYFRRSSLLDSTRRLPQQASPGGLTGDALERAGGGAQWMDLLREAKPEGGLGLRTGIGGGGSGGEWPPSSSLRPLALHCAEQWTGRVRPECLEVYATGAADAMSVYATAARPSLRSTSSFSNPMPAGAMVHGPTALGDPSVLVGIDNARANPPMTLSAATPLAGTNLSVGSTELSGGATTVAAPNGNTEEDQDGAGKRPWVAVGGSWRDEDNVCAYWRFSEGSGGLGPLVGEKQADINDLSKYGNHAFVKGHGMRLEDTTSPVDPGDKGKVAEAVDVCFPEEDISTARSSPVEEATGVSTGGVYQRGVFVRAWRGSSIDVGLFHDDQRRSVATLEFWVSAGQQLNSAAEEESSLGQGDSGDVRHEPRRDEGHQDVSAAPAQRRHFRQSFHVLACRVSPSGEHVWSLVIENNGQLALIPGPVGRSALGAGYQGAGGDDEGRGSQSAKIPALKEAVVTRAGAFSWDKWNHVALCMDTSRDESMADVLLFLDSRRVGQGTCRFNKVRHVCMEETWMVLGPNLVGWKLTEVRLWAMSRDEEALQDWKENSLALAETKKAKLIIRGISKTRVAAAVPSRGGKLDVPGKLAPPPATVANNAAKRRSKVGGVSPSSRDVAPVRSVLLPGPLLPGPAQETPVPARPTRDPRKVKVGVGALNQSRPSRDPRKAGLTASRLPTATTGPTRARLPPPPKETPSPASRGVFDTFGLTEVPTTQASSTLATSIRTTGADRARDTSDAHQHQAAADTSASARTTDNATEVVPAQKDTILLEPISTFLHAFGGPATAPGTTSSFASFADDMSETSVATGGQAPASVASAWSAFEGIQDETVEHSSPARIATFATPSSWPAFADDTAEAAAAANTATSHTTSLGDTSLLGKQACSSPAGASAAAVETEFEGPSKSLSSQATNEATSSQGQDADFVAAYECGAGSEAVSGSTGSGSIVLVRASEEKKISADTVPTVAAATEGAESRESAINTSESAPAHPDDGDNAETIDSEDGMSREQGGFSAGGRNLKEEHDGARAASLRPAVKETLDRDDVGKVGSSARDHEDKAPKTSPGNSQQVSPTKLDLLRGDWTWRGADILRVAGAVGNSSPDQDSLPLGMLGTSATAVAQSSTSVEVETTQDDAAKLSPDVIQMKAPVSELLSETPFTSPPGSSLPATPDPASREHTAPEDAEPRIQIADHAVILAGPEAVLSPAEAAAAHARSPLLSSTARLSSVPSCKEGLVTIAVADLWNRGATTRYPIASLSAILSPRMDEQIIALLTEGAMQVFSVTQRIRRRREKIEASTVKFWKWLSADVIAIVTTEEVLSWDVRGAAMPQTLFKRHRPHGALRTNASRVCDYDATVDGRWGLLTVADSEVVCDGCSGDSIDEAGCKCETSLMLDLHDFAGIGETRCFRALGAAILDFPQRSSQATEAMSSDAEVAAGTGWTKPMLAAVVPSGHDSRAHMLRLMRLEGATGGEENVRPFAVILGREVPRSRGTRQLRRYLRGVGLPAVAYHLLLWRPEPELDLLAVVTLGGGLTVFRVEADAAALTEVFHDEGAFPGAVVGVKADSNGELAVVSAGVGIRDECWVVSRAFVRSGSGVK